MGCICTARKTIQALMQSAIATHTRKRIVLRHVKRLARAVRITAFFGLDDVYRASRRVECRLDDIIEHFFRVSLAAKRVADNEDSSLGSRSVIRQLHDVSSPLSAFAIDMLRLKRERLELCSILVPLSPLCARENAWSVTQVAARCHHGDGQSGRSPCHIKNELDRDMQPRTLVDDYLQCAVGYTHTRRLALHGRRQRPR